MALESSVSQALDDEDAPTAQLALTYARTIDAHLELLPDLGPKLLATLEALLLTPKAKAAAMRGVKDAQRPKSPLDELRARRARKSATADLDPTAS
jgi:hypothetical protein